MITYKAYTWDGQEIVFLAEGDQQAYEHAQDLVQRESIQTDGAFQPIIYREDTPTSTYGCGYDSCKLCNAWICLSDETLTIHGGKSNHD